MKDLERAAGSAATTLASYRIYSLNMPRELMLRLEVLLSQDFEKRAGLRPRALPSILLCHSRGVPEIFHKHEGGY